MIDHNLRVWKKLQQNDYFANHKQYKNFQLALEDSEIIEKIKDKVIVDIGCGYGRETYYFSKYAKKVYGIEVSSKILNEAFDFIKMHGDIYKVKLVLAEHYEKKILLPIDFVYARHVFQHISPKLCKQYLDFFRRVLTPEGEIDILFRIGTQKRYCKKPEPLIEYSPKEIKELFKQYHIISIKKEKGKGYYFWRIKANAK